MKKTQCFTLKFCFIPRCRGCKLAEQADGIIARQHPLATRALCVAEDVCGANVSEIKRLGPFTCLYQTY